MYHTLGQRKGLHIGGIKERGAGRWRSRRLVLSPERTWTRTCCMSSRGHDHPALLKGELIAEQLSWVSGQAPHTHWVYRRRATGPVISLARSSGSMPTAAKSGLPSRSGRSRRGSRWCSTRAAFAWAAG